jgi:hypothetical protein
MRVDNLPTPKYSIGCELYFMGGPMESFIVVDVRYIESDFYCGWVYFPDSYDQLDDEDTEGGYFYEDHVATKQELRIIKLGEILG